MKKWSRVLLPCIIALQVLCALYFGGQKAGFHEDEYYSYYSSNRTAGFYYDDRTWTEMSDWRKEFTVEKGSGFDFGMVHLSQSWDVHPPLYYDILHLVCSLTPDIFSKWQGIGINIAAFILGQLVLYLLTLRLAGGADTAAASGDTAAAAGRGGGEAAALLTVALWGFTPAAMSMLMFIRMYALLTLWVLLCAYLHLREKQDLRTSILMGLVTLAGFLTHYYYIVFLVFIGLLKAAAYLKGRRFKELAAYVLCHAAALVAAVAVYPSAAVHILRGYRGREAQAAFLDAGNLWERVTLFGPILDEYVFGGFLAAALAVFVAAAFLRFRRERTPDRARICLFAASLLYFAVITKTALQLGASSVRYILPVCPLFIMLFVLAAGRLAAATHSAAAGTVIACAACAAVFAGNCIGLFGGKVLFLYTEEKEETAYAAQAAAEGIPAAVIYNPASPYNCLRVADQLLTFDRIYLIDPDNTEPVSDDAFDGAGSILVFSADDTGGEEAIRDLFGRDSTEKLWNRDMYTVFRVR